MKMLKEEIIIPLQKTACLLPSGRSTYEESQINGCRTNFMQ
jgi:hypothetical protein